MSNGDKNSRFVAALACLLLAGCGIDQVSIGKPVEDRHGWGYATMRAEGMPCLLFYRTSGSNVWSYEGVTCDWSKHKGNSK